MIRKGYVNNKEVYITVVNNKGHYEFFEGKDFIRSCESGELTNVENELKDEYENDYGKFVNFVYK